MGGGGGRGAGLSGAFQCLNPVLHAHPFLPCLQFKEGDKQERPQWLHDLQAFAKAHPPFDLALKMEHWVLRHLSQIDIRTDPGVLARLIPVGTFLDLASRAQANKQARLRLYSLTIIIIGAVRLSNTARGPTPTGWSARAFADGSLYRATDRPQHHVLNEFYDSARDLLGEAGVCCGSDDDGDLDTVSATVRGPR